jgi:hypothetical protein
MLYTFIFIKLGITGRYSNTGKVMHLRILGEGDIYKKDNVTGMLYYMLVLKSYRNVK